MTDNPRLPIHAARGSAEECTAAVDRLAEAVTQARAFIAQLLRQADRQA